VLAFLLAANVVLKFTNASTAIKSHFDASSTSASASVSYGPFSVSASGSHSDENISSSAHVQGNSVTSAFLLYIISSYSNLPLWTIASLLNLPKSLDGFQRCFLPFPVLIKFNTLVCFNRFSGLVCILLWRRVSKAVVYLFFPLFMSASTFLLLVEYLFHISL